METYLALKIVLAIFVFGYRQVFPERLESHLMFIGATVLILVTTEWFGNIVNLLLG